MISIKALPARAADVLFPRRCPFCGAVLGADVLQGVVCPTCTREEMRLQHLPPRLPEGEHDFYALSEAAAAYYYADSVRRAILRCKRGGRPWYARELADRMAVLVFGALPARKTGDMPQYLGLHALPVYNCIVPVPPRRPLPGVPGLPLLLARRLGEVLGLPVETPLYLKNPGREQKQLTREQRLQNAKDAFACRPGTDLTGKRVLLVDDIITTGATASACALELLKAGATDVTAAAIAAAEELPREKQKH
ncbi:ComF family protein [Gemmiger sp.]